MKPGLESDTISYEESKELARHEDPQVRAKLAQRADIKPEILYFLAEDDDPEVRRTVAENMAAPRQTDILLARDGDQEVRSGLAGKVAALAPGLSADEQDSVRRSTYEALEILAKDQITVVRQLLSEALKDVADAPGDVIKTLALDTEIEVSGPVLEFSPLLTDEDLIEIIEQGPAAGGLNAISRRAEVRERVSDALVATDDVGAIADLLANDSAMIREETLDDLIERAPSVELWHAPLTRRPKLPRTAATRLAQFLADNLLEELQERTDFDAETMEAIKSVVHERLEGGSDGLGNGALSASQDFLTIDLPVDMAERLYQARKLDGKVIEKALKAGDHGFVLAAMIVKAETDTIVAKRIFLEKSAKGMVALCWKSGLPPKVAVQVQQKMGRIAPSDIIDADGGADYSMSSDEMNFQLEFFADLVGKGAG